MLHRTIAICLALVPAAAFADPKPTPDVQDVAPTEEPSHAAEVAREGQTLPQTFSATIGHKAVVGVFTGGYDSAPGAGPAFGAVVEGQLWNRVALRVGVDYQDAIHSVYPTAGVRVGILRQDKYKVDLGVIAQYKNLGFSEASGEFEMGVAVGHRWNKLGVQANALYGQGLVPGERDAELRASALYFVHPKINVGLDMRARLDLGEDNAQRQKDKLENDFDFLGGAVAQVVVLKHLILLAEVGPHVVIFQEKASAGALAIGGIAATY
jgi:hypothetical protein